MFLIATKTIITGSRTTLWKYSILRYKSAVLRRNSESLNDLHRPGFLLKRRSPRYCFCLFISVVNLHASFLFKLCLLTTCCRRHEYNRILFIRAVNTFMTFVWSWPMPVCSSDLVVTLYTVSVIVVVVLVIAATAAGFWKFVSIQWKYVPEYGGLVFLTLSVVVVVVIVVVAIEVVVVAAAAAAAAVFLSSSSLLLFCFRRSPVSNYYWLYVCYVRLMQKSCRRLKQNWKRSWKRDRGAIRSFDRPKCELLIVASFR